MIGLYVFYGQLGWLPGPGRLDSGVELPPRVTGLYTADALVAGDLLLFWNADSHLILPSIVLAAFSMGLITRMTRSAMLESLGQDYVLSVRSKGLHEARVIFRHSFRNALIPTVTVLGLSYGNLLTGAVLTETIFSWRFTFPTRLAASIRKDRSTHRTSKDRPDCGEPVYLLSSQYCRQYRPDWRGSAGLDLLTWGWLKADLPGDFINAAAYFCCIT